MRRRILGALVLGVTAALTLSSALMTSASAAEPDQVRVVFETARGEVPVFAEVATTHERRRIGLMYRLYMPPGTAMVFPMGSERIQSFWMRNTVVSLDMLFVTADLRIAGIVHRATPLTESPRYVRRKSMFVIELPGGWARIAGIEAGDKVRYEAFR